MLTIDSIDYLRSREGERALAAAAELELGSGSLLRDLTRLRRTLPAERAAAVIEQTGLRRRAADKFALAGRMLFTAGALEQATGERVAAHTSARYRAFGRVADYCCGIGGDTLALARHARVEAVDHDAVRLACAEHNARVHELAHRIDFRFADVTTLEPSGVEAIFFDPSRRDGGRRIFSLGDYRPPVAIIERWLQRVPAIGVKVAPGVAKSEIVWDCEQEFIAEGPALKECLLWFGSLAAAGRRASVLPAGATLTEAAPAPPPVIAEPAGWLYDPSPAVTRAGLIWELAALLGGRQIDPRVGYLSADTFIATPFARAYRIDEWMPFNLKRLKARLRTLGAGRAVIRRRGAPIETDVLERQLRGGGDDERALFLTRLRGRPIVIIGRGPANESNP
jgi:hypothetical protein